MEISYKLFDIYQAEATKLSNVGLVKIETQSSWNSIAYKYYNVGTQSTQRITFGSFFCRNFQYILYHSLFNEQLHLPEHLFNSKVRWIILYIISISKLQNCYTVYLKILHGALGIKRDLGSMSQTMVTVNEGTDCAHGKVIWCNFKPGSVERSIDDWSFWGN
jgi:hypothetical protein